MRRHSTEVRSQLADKKGTETAKGRGALPEDKFDIGELFEHKGHQGHKK